MDVLRLRIMTEKSVLGYGKYADCTVRQVIDLSKKGYLRWMYYNLSRFSFTEEVLNIIGIYDTFRIEKPGTDKERGLELENYKFAMVNKKGSSLAGIKMAARIKKLRKAKYKRRFHSEKKFNSRGYLQSRNHGHN